MPRMIHSVSVARIGPKTGVPASVTCVKMTKMKKDILKNCEQMRKHLKNEKMNETPAGHQQGNQAQDQHQLQDQEQQQKDTDSEHTHTLEANLAPTSLHARNVTHDTEHGIRNTNSDLPLHW